MLPVPVIAPQPIVPTVMFGVPVRLAAVDAVEALPVKVPSTLARSVALATNVRSPVDAPVAAVVASLNLSSDSSHPIKILF